MEFFRIAQISTSEQEREKAVIHLTINRTRKQDEFVEEIHQFLDDLAEGLESKFSV